MGGNYQRIDFKFNNNQIFNFPKVKETLGKWGSQNKNNMHNWFEVKIKDEKTAEEGRIVKVTESYLVDALTFGEAEERINKEMEPFISGEFTVVAIKKAKINEMFFNDNGDKWFKARVNFISIDEEKGFEKKIATNMMVQADDVKEAEAGIREGMKGSMADYQIASVTETPIMDVFKFEVE